MASLPLIAVEASWAQLGVSGVGRYLAGLLPELAKRADVVALLDERRPNVDLGVATVSLRSPVRLPCLAWLEVAVAPWLRRNPALLHAAAYTAPVSYRGPAVATLHDVAWLTDPTDFGPVKRWAWTAAGAHTARACRELLTGSLHSRDQIVRAMKVSSHRVHVVPDAVDPDLVAESHRGPSVLGVADPYVVALGGAPRRNLPLAVAAWEEARRLGSRAELAVVGNEPVRARPGLHHLGAIDDRGWGRLLAGAEAFLYPTAHEGFGLPAAEAIACGTPVIAARLGALPEVLGEAAVWSPSLGTSDLARTLLVLTEDRAGRSKRRRAALAQAAVAPTWADAATATIEVYERAWAGWGAG